MQSAAPNVFCANCLGRDVVFSGAVCGSLVYTCDCLSADMHRQAILAYWENGPRVAKVLEVTYAPFGLLLGWGLNDPWV